MSLVRGSQVSKVVRIIKSGCRVFLWAHLFVWPVVMILDTWGLLPNLPRMNIVTTDILLCFLAFMTMFTLRSYHNPSAAEEWLASAEFRIRAIEDKLSNFEYEAHRSDIIKSKDY